jgi:hypothetical protein
MQLELIHGDRRADRRHAIALDLRFTYRRHGRTYLGAGRTAELSRGGVRFLAEDPVPDGAETDLHIHWPFLLQDVLPLELVMHGTILRTDERGTVLRARSYAFETCGRRSFHAAAPRERSWSILA